MPDHHLTASAGHRLADRLKDHGHAILPKAIAPECIRAIEALLQPTFTATPFCEGAFYGLRTKRFGRLLRRCEAIQELVLHPAILAAAEQLLSPWCDVIQLNLTQAIEIHPGAVAQFPHRDQDMWAGAKGEMEYLVNILWPLTPFTADNGATRIWRNSHGPAAHDANEPSAPPLVAEALPGDAILFLGSTLHAAGANRTRFPRRAVIISYSLGWLKPFENPWLAYPPPIARCFPRPLAELAGYRQHRPNLGNFEGQCPSILLETDVPEHLAAIDALRPDQTAAVRAFAAAQADPPVDDRRKT
ncbi:Phytanoyl-CoA dioxygenase (PhyH) [Sphingomonas laterariae]|uniref:Phytanoyl-CoA dioxygenase (PhyH) n=1 Tax=Edaphosphingomonas laterariae TaxID=861865 RepID=A0A239I3C0_9SPHN|nr:phytanoyl-CoA dioxygenase family protein [Sphingomonas laterariae]SNS87981.1 Phytanoyl-CoA dioxygenase (PhyH) [Sphingomonas laterariae]